MFKKMFRKFIKDYLHEKCLDSIVNCYDCGVYFVVEYGKKFTIKRDIGYITCYQCFKCKKDPKQNLFFEEK